MSIRVRVALKNMGMIEKQMAGIFKERVAKAMKIAARQCIPVLSARVWDAPPASDSPYSKGPAHASGAFLAGWMIDYDADKLQVLVYNRAVHAGWVENGVRASATKMGVTAVQNIEDWLILKGIKFNDSKGRSLSSRKMAWAIVGAMNRRKGWRLKGRLVAQRSRPRIEEIFKKRIMEAYTRAIEEAVITRGRSLGGDLAGSV